MNRKFITPGGLLAIFLASTSSANENLAMDFSNVDLSRYSTASHIFYDLDGNKIEDGTPVLFEKKEKKLKAKTNKKKKLKVKTNKKKKLKVKKNKKKKLKVKKNKKKIKAKKKK